VKGDKGIHLRRGRADFFYREIRLCQESSANGEKHHLGGDFARNKSNGIPLEREGALGGAQFGCSDLSRIASFSGFSKAYSPRRIGSAINGD